MGRMRLIGFAWLIYGERWRMVQVRFGARNVLDVS